MPRRKPKDRLAVQPVFEESKHDKMLSEMHDALYTLGNKIRKPSPSRGNKLLPKELQEKEPEGADVARSTIEQLHKAMSTSTKSKG